MIFFNENIYSTLSYTSQPYAEVMDMRMDVSYAPCAKSPREKLAIQSHLQSLKRGVYYLKLRIYYLKLDTMWNELIPL